MKTRIEEVWDELHQDFQKKPTIDGGYKLLRIDPSFRFDVFGGVDSSGYVLLAIGISKTPPAVKIESASLDYFRQQRSNGTWLMALRLRQIGLSGVFGRLCQDLLDSMATVGDEESLVALFRERLKLWKKLFDHGRDGFLESHEVKGLLAELLVLDSILLSGKRPPHEVVAAWVGPTGSDQDFQFADEAIEVKAVGPGAEYVSISSLQQLDAAIPIQLCVIPMRSASLGEPEAIGLNSLVPGIEERLIAVPDALSLFRSRLLEGGYVEDPHYDKILFQSMGIEKFTIDDLSPKLIVATVPQGVTSANYSLSLEFLRNLR